MSSWAKPGVKCICISDAIGTADGFPPRFPLFQKGQIFTVSGIDTWRGMTFLRFVGENPLHAGHIEGFRPLITKTLSEDIALFKAISEDVYGRMEVLEEELNR